MKQDLSSKRVFMVAGHAQSGKTMLCEALLHAMGAINAMGSIEQGTTVSDYAPDEVERKSSINASFFHAIHNNIQYQFVDAPGYVDFIGETISAAAAVDFAIIVIDASAGIGVGTERVWEIVRKRSMPCMFFIDKLDREHVDFEKTMNEIREIFGSDAVLAGYPVGTERTVNLLNDGVTDTLPDPHKSKAKEYFKQLVEQIAETDDTLLEKYLETGRLPRAELVPVLKKDVLEGRIYPIICGSVARNEGIDILLSEINEIMPSPADIAPLTAKDADGAEVTVRRDPADSLAARVVKTMYDPYLGQISIVRVQSGTLTGASNFVTVQTQTREKAGHVYFINGKDRHETDAAYPGDLAAVTKLKDAHTGMSLCDPRRPLTFSEPSFPTATYSASLKPKTRQDEDKVAKALHFITAEDPTFQISRDVQTGELVVSGLGELHLSIIVNRIKKRFGADIELGTPKVPYRETLLRKASAQGKHKKQSGGHGQYGDCWLEVEPLERGAGFEFVDKIVGGAIPRNFIPSVEKGVRNVLNEGLLAGYPITDIRVTLYDGSYHDVDSSDMAFQIAARLAMKKIWEDGSPALLEPLMDVEITTPDEFTGTITGDLSTRRGRVMGMEAKGKNTLVKAQMPMAELFKYASALKSVTGGRGSYTMTFSHYDIVPQRIAQEIVEHANQEKAAAHK